MPLFIALVVYVMSFHFIPAMAGDVNMFLNDPDDAGIAEIEVMVAEEGW